MKIVWHVDDLKISHQDGWEVTKIIKWLGKIHGDIKVKRGRKHHYLGMDMDFEERGVVKFSMIPYVQEIIKNFPEKNRNIDCSNSSSQTSISSKK